MSGRLIVMGSGEMAPSLVATHRKGIEAAGAGEVTILDTPFGFQENAEQLTQRLVDFFAASLRLPATVATLRTPAADVVMRERMVATVRRSRYVFAGPGSPSYALRVWANLALADALERVIVAGGTVTFASAAALTLGCKTLPVYEIYKVGQAPHWLDGIDLMTRLHLPSVVVPHWNNAEGGSHDTSRCYIGKRRFAALQQELAVETIGVDEHTAAVFDFAAGTLSVQGRGGVTIGRAETQLASGDRIELDRVRALLAAPPQPSVAPPAAEGPLAPLGDALAAGDGDAAAAALLAAEARAAGDPALRSELRAMIVELADAAEAGMAPPEQRVGPFVRALLDLRHRARTQGDYETADRIRNHLLAAGVEVRDTLNGVEWRLRDPGSMRDR